MAIDAQLVAKLRQITGAGIMDCRNALEKNEGNMEKAQEYLRKQGVVKADKKAERVAGEGIVASYMHPNNKLGVLVKLQCETDFVAKNTEFQELARDIAMHIAAANPTYLSRKEIPTEILEKEKEIYREQMIKEGKKLEVLEKILENKLEKYYQDVCLLDQQFVKDETMTITDLIKQKIAKTGEKMEITQFVRIKI